MVAGAAQSDWAEEQAFDRERPADSFRWSDLFNPATITGFADCSVVLLLARGLNVSWGMVAPLEKLYIAMTIGKLILLVISWNQRAPLTRTAKWVLCSIATMVFATTLTGVASFGPYQAIVAFLVNLSLTLMLIGGRPLNRYLLGPVLIIFSTGLWHAVLCLTHRMPSWFGRYFYFGHNMFNLGGEIEAIGCLAAALLLPRILSLPVLAVLLVDMALLQARSALLAGAAVTLVVLLFDGRRQLKSRRALSILFIAPLAVLALAGLGGGSFVSNILMINDPYRGVSTGGSGRTGLWAQSLEIFKQSPVFGHDLSYFQSIGFIGSHNLFLQGLAQYGLMSVFFFWSLIYGFAVAFSRDKYRFALLACALPLLLFNDRFASLNPYPFMFYVLLTAPFAKSAAPSVQAAQLRPMRPAPGLETSLAAPPPQAVRARPTSQSARGTRL